MPSFADPTELNVGDLCVYEGDTEHCSMQQRIIYRVTAKVPTPSAHDPGAWTSKWAYAFVVVFDMFPASATSERYLRDQHGSPRTIITKHGTRGVRRLDLLSLARLRNDFDIYIRARALEMGADHDA